MENQTTSPQNQETNFIRQLHQKLMEELKKDHFFGVDQKIRHIQKTAALNSRV